jgi:hypothetical protein
MDVMQARLITEWERLKNQAAPLFSVNIVKQNFCPVIELNNGSGGVFRFCTLGESFAFLKGIDLQKQISGEEGPT